MIALDSSSLILLAKLGVLDIAIDHSKQKFVIVDEVYREVMAKKDALETKFIQKRIEEKKMHRQTVNDIKLVHQIQNDFNIGSGEAEVIALCIDKKMGIIIDDKKGIQTCKIFKIPFTTTPAIIIILYKKKIITKIQAHVHIKKLKEIGRYSEQILQQFREDIQ